jgi:hypothetical protein
MFFVPFAFAGEDAPAVPTTCNLLDIDTGTYIPCVAGKTISVEDIISRIKDTGTEPSTEMFAKAFHEGKYVLLYDGGKEMSLTYSKENGFGVSVRSDDLFSFLRGFLFFLAFCFITWSASLKTSRWWVRPFSLAVFFILIIFFAIEKIYLKEIIAWFPTLPLASLAIGLEIFMHFLSKENLAQKIKA